MTLLRAFSRRKGGGEQRRKSKRRIVGIVSLLLLPALACSLVAFLMTLQQQQGGGGNTLGESGDNNNNKNNNENLLNLHRLLVTTNTKSNATTASVNLPREDQFLTMKTSIDSTTTKGNATAGCFSTNAREWLNGPRFGNIMNDLSDHNDNFARNMILSPISLQASRTILGQSTCHANSSFVNDIDGMTIMNTTDGSGTSSFSDLTPQPPPAWLTTVLVYLSLHLHQHRHAIPEAQIRLNRSHGNYDCKAGAREHGVGSFDYECPSAKFLIIRLFHNGVGANMRLGSVPAFWAGLATGRVIIIVNNAPPPSAAGSKSDDANYLQVPWKLASCGRRDHQCFFLPSTPCVLTHEELTNAYILKKHEMRTIFRTGELSEDHDDKRVVVLKLPFRPQRQPESVKQILFNLSQWVIDQLVPPSSSPSMGETNRRPTELRAWLQKAADRILQREDDPTEGMFNYFGARSPIFHGILLYATRPNRRSQSAMDHILNDTIPIDFDSMHSIGLPIRASDKCNSESECLSFSQYIKATSRFTAGTGATNTTSVVVTTESRDVLREMKSYISSNSNTAPLFPARFITNHHDVLQGTGYIDEIKKDDGYINVTADEAMLSAMSSLKLQLLTKYTTGNCCSNFHLLLKDFLSSGCGIHVDNTFQCLQDHPDPEFRPCCAWDKSPLCESRRKKQSSVTQG